MSQPSIKTATSFPDDCLPPEQDYESKDALIASINAWAKNQGLRIHYWEVD